MENVLTTQQAITITSKLRQQGKKIVLAGGCFDLLHIGHIVFLENAKKTGDTLFVLLENDDTIKKLKGEKRPINTQEDRAKILSSLNMVNYVILLPAQVTNDFYDKLVFQLKPAIIATTTGDSNRSHKERQAKTIDAQVIDVTMPVRDQSTTKLLQLLEEL